MTECFFHHLPILTHITPSKVFMLKSNVQEVYYRAGGYKLESDITTERTPRMWARYLEFHYRSFETRFLEWGKKVVGWTGKSELNAGKTLNFIAR